MRPSVFLKSNWEIFQSPCDSEEILYTVYIAFDWLISFVTLHAEVFYINAVVIIISFEGERKLPQSKVNLIFGSNPSQSRPQGLFLLFNFFYFIPKAKLLEV